MIDTTIEIYSSNAQAISTYSTSTGTTTTVPTLTLKYRERNTSTSLVLHGDSAYNYGQDILTNFLHLAENFCSPTAPSLPILGQKYYNSDTAELLVYDSGWNEIQVIENTDTLDIVYESEYTSNHSIYTLPYFTSALLPLTGNTNLSTITLPGVKPTEDSEAVTKQYVDSVLTAPAPYLPRTGYAEMYGPLLLADTLRTGTDDTLVNIKYVNELGTVSIIPDKASTGKYLSMTYSDVGRVDNTGTVDTSPWFTTIAFQDSIADGASVVTVALPFAFVQATSSTTNYTVSASAVCSSTGSSVKLTVTFIDNSNISVKRSGTTGVLNFNGIAYGFRSRS